MLIIHNKEPFDHFIIKDVFVPISYREIFDELVFLRPRMGGPETTGASNNKEDASDTKKKGVGIFLDKIYQNLSQSSIYFHTRKFFNNKELNNAIISAQKSNYYFKHWNPDSLSDSIIAQYYDHGDFYKPHHDAALFSAVTVFYQKPKAYEGGRFMFPEFDYSVEIEDNMTLLFPSVITHEVEQVQIPKSGQMIGRFSLTNFITFKV